MSKEIQRWAAAALGFAAAVMWTTVGAQAALTCLLGAGLCAGAAIAREEGLIGRLTSVATGARRRLQAAVPAPTRPTARPSSRRQAQAAPPRRKPIPTPKPKAAIRPYDHDEPSGEHVYEVANYGW
jgi:cell division septation protein DedD